MKLHLLVMNIHRLRIIVIGLCLMCASFVAGAYGLFIGDKSAQDAFHDEGVAKLIKAAINGDKLEVNKLIGSGVNINATGDGGVTPLVWVEINNDLAAMQLLLDLGADPDKVILPGVGKQAFGPPVWMAAAAGRREILEILLNHGANPNLIFGNDTPVMMAIQESHLDCAELLLRHGADINKTVGPVSALTETMIHVRFDSAVWVLQHGFTHDLEMARRMLSRSNPRSGQEAMKEQALEMIDKLLAEQNKQ